MENQSGSNPMYAMERQQRILGETRSAGRVEVASLADVFGVTPETIRRDLTLLERRGSLRRVHGGAIPVERLGMEPTLVARSEHHMDAKRRIAARVLQELPADATILLDAGSTTQELVNQLPADSRFTILTNSIPIAASLVGRSNITLYVVGGLVRGVTGAAVGDWAPTALADVVADVAVLGTNGISASRGLTTPNQAEAAVKIAMVSAAKRVIVATDSSKAGDDHLHRFAHLSDVDLVVTDTELADEIAEEWRVAGPEVVAA
ncbi:MAG: DeoR/GlpR family DNA-binding transcription regulator [Propionibacteriaceae bacterium]|nr:DeoR/GlpR family DNA-binding transcription regulator [Propionibacteriaceae bacterium]